MKRSKITSLTVLLLIFTSQLVLAQSNPSNSLDFGEEASSGNDLNSIKIIPAEEREGSIKIKSFDYKSKTTPKKVSNTKKGQDLSLEDLERIAAQRSNLHYRNKRKLPEKCFKEESNCDKKDK
ncbi:hypothetical protein [Tenacibaculum sp. IB213877]|uniref:hypothetical protein n=1 Tax=Tenacibaculum sp. IB213877 TaxID=3097351 RepID=UPI002A5B0F1F|nr:hypothetical protein [Tenacibaculum sp. IB213877]MDY0780039.1 hypothetical protein [Tenacibaculum sp. IB213877]